ncbi:putative zinc finger protein [Abeliophyllum distichum]|uniref:Zinc finger protein n=1 Tax=Abeliophyllum distichum TaxID=126358 RepID=A0ABD1RRX8_9LAMI
MIKNPISEFLERTQQHLFAPPVLAISRDNDSSINTSSDESSYESSDGQLPAYMAETVQTSQEQPTEQQPHAEESTPEVVKGKPTVISEDDVVTSPPPIFINPSLPTPSSSSVKFTLDDVLPQKWKTKFQEMQAWCFAELQTPHMTHSTVIKSLLARLTGFMKDWFDFLGQYRQLQYLNAPTVDEFMNALYWKFCGKQDHLKDIAREEFFKLKCCFYNPKDLNKHFENAVRRLYLIGEMDDPNIKQAYLESIPQPLGQETLRVIEMRGQSLGTTSFDELYNMVLRTLKKLCNQRAVLTDIHTIEKKLEKACERPELKVKYRHDNKSCSCPGKKKHHIKRLKFSKRHPKPFTKKRRFFKRKFSKKERKSLFHLWTKGTFFKELS